MYAVRNKLQSVTLNDKYSLNHYNQFNPCRDSRDLCLIPINSRWNASRWLYIKRIRTHISYTNWLDCLQMDSFYLWSVTGGFYRVRLSSRMSILYYDHDELCERSVFATTLPNTSRAQIFHEPFYKVSKI